MKQKRPILLLAASLILLLAAAGALYQNLSRQIAPVQPEPENAALSVAEPVEDTRRPAPDFTVFDSDGSEVHLSDYAGKPVVLGFWATWCPSCRRELPVFQELIPEYADVSFLLVNITSEEASQEAVISFLEENGYSFPAFFDPDASAMDAYVAYSLPVTYFISGDGKITHQVLGSLNRTTLQEGIALIFSDD